MYQHSAPGTQSDQDPRTPPVPADHEGEMQPDDAMPEWLVSDQALRRVLESAGCLLWTAEVVLRDGELIWDTRVFNKDGAQRFLPLEIPPGKSYDDAWYASKLDEEWGRMDRLSAQSIHSAAPGYRQEFRCRRADGAIRWISEDVRITQTAAGRWRLVGVCTDTTERREAEDALRFVMGHARCILWHADVTEKEEGPGQYRWHTAVVDEEAAQRFLPLDVGPAETYCSAWVRSRVPEDAWRPNQVSGDALRAGAPGYAHEFRCRDKHGRVRWLHEQASIQKVGPGEFRVVGVCTDITERLQAEEALREAEARYRTLFEQAPYGILVIDPETALPIAFNDVACRQLGYSRDEFARLRVSDWEALEDPNQIRGRMERVLAGESHTFGTQLLTKGGQLRDVQVVIRAVRLSGRLVLHTVHRDVTERKQATQSLARQAAVIEAMPQMVATVDGEGRLTSLNRSGRRMLGLGREADVSGISLPDLCAESAREAVVREGIPSALRDGIWMNESAVRGEDGKGIPVSLILIATQASGQTDRFLSVIALDVSERVRLEAELRQAQKMDAIGRLAGGVAHDFNNVLTPLLAYSDLLVKGLATGSPARGYAEEILRITERAAALPRQLLTFSRKQVLQPKVLDLNAVVGDVEKMLHRVIGEDIELRISLDPQLARVVVDPGQVEQVILNLALNARDAMPNGGTLVIETANGMLDSGSARLHPGMDPGPHVTLTIGDTGCGMDSATQARIFEPFFTTKEPGKGTGLGLSTVYGIVAQSGGHIHVESEPGVGTTFRIHLPQTSAEPEQPEPRADSPTARVPAVVLVVEDEEIVRTVLCEVLRHDGLTVLEASGGPEALQASAGHAGPIHLLLTDLVMPGMSGIELAERFLADRPATKVLYMSGYAEDVAERLGADALRDAFLQKPMSPTELTGKVRQVMGGAPTVLMAP